MFCGLQCGSFVPLFDMNVPRRRCRTIRRQRVQWVAAKGAAAVAAGQVASACENKAYRQDMGGFTGRDMTAVKIFGSASILMRITHLFSCYWYWVGDATGTCVARWADQHPCTGSMSPICQPVFISARAGCFAGAYLSHSLWHRYLIAFYWSLTSLSTVGYGDITPVRHANFEPGFTIRAFVVACAT